MRLRWRAQIKCQSPRSGPMRFNTAVTTSGPTRPANAALRRRQSTLFKWSARTHPSTGKSGGRSTSNGYPLRRLVTGHISDSPVRELYPSGDSTRAGRLPALLATRLRIEVQPDQISPVRNPGGRHHASLPAGSLQPVAACRFSAVTPASRSSRVGLSATA